MMDTSMNSMVETLTDTRQQIEEGLKNYRRNKMSVVRAGDKPSEGERLVQLSIGGTEIWRRLALPDSTRLEDLHGIIQVVFGWSGKWPHHFIVRQRGVQIPEKQAETMRIDTLIEEDASFIEYEYGERWVLRVMFLSTEEALPNGVLRVVGGEKHEPPEDANGPVRYRRLAEALYDLDDDYPLHNEAVAVLGEKYNYDDFDLDECNLNLRRLQRGKNEKNDN
jgi:hypothetical protein